MFTLGQTSLPCRVVVEVFGLYNVDDPASSREFKNDV
jgi:hypothetical protein